MKRLPAAVCAIGLLGATGGCSPGATQHAAAHPTATASATARAGAPAAGPLEDASKLPKSCSAILSDTDLATAFGSPQTGDTSYGAFAPLPKIGRTGRVTCGYGIGIDPSGRASAPSLTVSVITYDTAATATTRVASNISGNVAKGATRQSVLVDGHPATVLVLGVLSPAQPSVGVSQSPSAGASAPVSAVATPTAVATPAGETELLMADGNRTFVVEIPLAKLSGTGAVNVLINVAELVYRHTLPSA
jgi:hypothetical protein